MPGFNRVMLMGNLTRDVEVRWTKSGMAVADLRLAVNDSYTNKAGETVEQTCYVDVEVWARQAETCEQYLSKGSPVFVEGSLRLDEWKTQNGESRSRLKVKAARVLFIGAPRGAQLRDGPEGRPPAGRPSGAPPAAQEEERLPADDEPRPEPGKDAAGDEPRQEPAKDGAGDEDNLPF